MSRNESMNLITWIKVSPSKFWALIEYLSQEKLKMKTKENCKVNFNISKKLIQKKAYRQVRLEEKMHLHGAL